VDAVTNEVGEGQAERDDAGDWRQGLHRGHDAAADMSSSRAVRVMRQLRVPAGLKPRRMPLRHQSVTVRWGICKMAATCSGVRTSVGVMCCNVQRYRFTV
jgi:hypothetical protein